MTNHQVAEDSQVRLLADAAFVVHLTAHGGEAPEVSGSVELHGLAFGGVRGRVEHITSGRATRFGSLNELLGFMRQVVGVLLLVAWALPAWSQPDDACLIGSHPSVAGDADQIAQLRDLIDANCPCAGFDGSDGAARGDYRRCVTPRIKAAVTNGHLRAKCKGVVAKALKQSTCGAAESFDVLPCVEARANGKVGCRIVVSDKCLSDGRVTRVACPGFSYCVDAGDNNGDYVVNGGDSGACVLPAATASSTTTATPTPTATETPTDTPTSSPTHTPENTATSTPTASACASSTSIIAHVVVNEFDDPQVVVFPPAPAANQCNPQTLLGGGCEINGLDGTIVNTFDASASVDPARCPGDPAPSFHWELFRPPGLGGTPYSAAGITGYHATALTIHPNSFPSLEDTEAAGDPNWRVLLTVQSNVSPFNVTQKWFRFEYTSSSLTLQMSTDCQRIGHIQDPECTVEASNGLPATEPT